MLGTPSGHRLAGQTLPERQDLPTDSPATSPSDDHWQSNHLALKLAQTVAVADFNGYGIDDVARADFIHDSVVVMAGSHDGRFTTMASLAGQGPRSIVASDFDLNGTLDIAVANFLSGDVRIFFGKGKGEFGEPRIIRSEPGIASLSGNDIDGDGDTDLTVANFLSGRVSVMTASGAGAFERERTVGHAPGTSLLLHRDVNEDGIADLLAVDHSGTNLRLLAGRVEGGFADAARIEADIAFPDDLHSEISTAGDLDVATVRIVSGDGQAGRSGSLLPEALVFEVRGSDGNAIVGGPIVFSTLDGADAVNLLWTDQDGNATVRLAASDLPQNHLVAAAVPEVGVVVAGAVSALSAAGVREALVEIEALGRADQSALLQAALDGLTAGEEIRGVATLMSALAQGASRTSATGGDDALSSLAKRAINQLLLIGPASPGPDLVETAVSEPPAIVAVKDKFTVTDTARNQGTDPAGASTTRYYLSVDGVLKTTLLGGGGRNVPGLNPGIDSAGSDLVTVPAGARTGTYFLLACADDRKVIVEDDEGNNCRASTGQVQVKAADLVVTTMSEPPANTPEGSNFNVSDTTMNSGDWPAGQSTTSFYLSLDKKKSVADVLIASRIVPGLTPGQASSDTIAATVSAAPGVYYMIACADALKKVAESNAAKKGETNNCLASTGTVTVVPGEADGGPVDNGALRTGRIAGAGEIDVWTFAASSGQRISVHIGEIVDNNDFRPWIRLLAPNGTVLGNTSGVSAAAIEAVAAATGTYQVQVASFDSGLDGTGTYRLTTTRTPGPITVSPGDQGGPLTNGAIHEGQILQGDVDVWTFTANAGERISLHVGEITDTDDFRPWIRLWAPNGASLGDTAGVSADVIDDVVAGVTGTYLVQVASFDSGVDGEGTYRLTMTHTPGPITVSPGDQGGPLTNGAIHEGQILQGDVDVWTFTANAGERSEADTGAATHTHDLRPCRRLSATNGARAGAAGALSAAS